MQWLAFSVWIIVAALAVPIGREALLGRISFGVQAMAVAGSLALIVIYLIAGGSGFAWAAFALGIVALLAIAVGSTSLTAEPYGTAHPTASAVEEQDAGLAGTVVPLLATAIFVTLLVALDIGLAD